MPDMMTMRTFDECMSIADEAGGKKHLMLGNGFSVSLFPHIFNYTKLAEKISSEHIKELFEKIDTNDFEFVMRRLYETREIVDYYEDTTVISRNLKDDLEGLKETLIQVITDSHPSSPSAIAEAEYNTCHRFLANFDGKKYTFNYDLILYWVYMHFKDDSERKLDCDDGFRYEDHEDHDLSVYWEIGREHTQTLYYLHGAMHIFSNGADIEKLSYNNTGIRLSDQVRTAVSQDKFPVFISEGTTEHKLTRIKGNAYLARSFSSIKGVGGNLFIFGHSIRDEDDHIFTYFNEKSRVKNVFISIYGDKESSSNQKIIEKINGWQEKFTRKKYYIYQAETVSVWR